MESFNEDFPKEVQNLLLINSDHIDSIQISKWDKIADFVFRQEEKETVLKGLFDLRVVIIFYE